jgi:hypothetical protein
MDIPVKVNLLDNSESSYLTTWLHFGIVQIPCNQVARIYGYIIITTGDFTMIVKISRKPMPCRCDEYDFPHRTGGGACRMKEPFDPSADDVTDYEPFSRHDYYVPFSWNYAGTGAGQ